MRIGIDCRMYGLKHAGIGRYVENLVRGLAKHKSDNEFILFFREKRDVPSELAENPNFKFVFVPIAHYSLKEQFFLPFYLYKEKLDLVHFPHFNAPFWYLGKFVVTIHDLIKHTSKGRETTTRNPAIYWLKYLGYKFIFWWTVKRATKILVPSEFVKGELIKEYGLRNEKVIVTYEGVDESIQVNNHASKDILNKYKISKPYLLYVGSVYPHKNIERLLEAIKLLKMKLVVVCGRSVFWEKLQKRVMEMGIDNLVNLVGYVPDGDLALLYKEAEAFTWPTLSEGFGLPGLEAMSIGTPIIVSDIPVFREVYGEAALYFDPHDPKAIAEKIKEFIGKKENKEKMVKKGIEQVKKYSWGKMAKETLQIYNTCLR